MEGVVGVMDRGAPGYDVEGRVVVDDDDVVQVLYGLVLPQHHAGLDGVFEVVSRLDVDEVPVGVLLVGLGGVLVLGRVDGLPIVVLDPGVMLERQPGGLDDDPLLRPVGAVGHAVVHEQDGPGAGGIVGVHADVDHLELEVVGGIGQVLYRGRLVPLALFVAVQVDVRSERGLLAECLLYLRIIALGHSSSTPYPFFLISPRILSGSPSRTTFPWMSTNALSALM